MANFFTSLQAKQLAKLAMALNKLQAPDLPIYELHYTHAQIPGQDFVRAYPANTLTEAIKEFSNDPTYKQCTIISYSMMN